MKKLLEDIEKHPETYGYLVGQLLVVFGVMATLGVVKACDKSTSKVSLPDEKQEDVAPLSPVKNATYNPLIILPQFYAGNQAELTPRTVRIEHQTKTPAFGLPAFYQREKA